jgi:hypothetical protein
MWIFNCWRPVESEGESSRCDELAVVPLWSDMIERQEGPGRVIMIESTAHECII